MSESVDEEPLLVQIEKTVEKEERETETDQGQFFEYMIHFLFEMLENINKGELNPYDVDVVEDSVGAGGSHA